MERAFRLDYARRYAGQRRLACASLILIWVAVVVRDWWLLNTLDPGILLRVGYVRLAGAVGMALPLWLMWGPRAFDERRSVRLLCVVILSCWFALLGLVNLYPPARVGKEIFPRLFCCSFPDIHVVPTSRNHGSMVSRTMRCNLPSYRTSPIHLGPFHAVGSLGYPRGYGGYDVSRWRCRLHSV
jgi:hypothetical protein